MKNLLLICLSATITLILSSCTKDLMDTEYGIKALNKTQFTAPAYKSSNSSTVMIQEDPDGPPSPYILIPGSSSKLTRNTNGISATFKTHGLVPGNAYTLWFVIFGNAPGPPIMVTYAAGHIANGNGKGNFAGHLSVDDVFNNPLTAEVHLALRSHGAAQPGIIPEQISTMDGGCTSGFPSGPALYPDSDAVGYCANIQVAIHPSN